MSDAHDKWHMVQNLMAAANEHLEQLREYRKRTDDYGDIYDDEGTADALESAIAQLEEKKDE